jgi:hypothetical protein
LGEISGTALAAGKPLASVTVRLRNIDTGAIVAQQRTNAQGEFRFTGVPLGNYVVETVDDDGRLLGTSVRISITSGALIATGITVTSTAGGAAGAAGAAAAAGAGSFFASTAGIITLIAIGAGVGAVVIANSGDSSPSR